MWENLCDRNNIHMGILILHYISFRLQVPNKFDEVLFND